VNSTEKVAKYLKENAKPLADEIVDDIVSQFGFEVPQKDIDEAKKVYIEFFGFLAESFTCTEGSVPEELVTWSKENGEKSAAKHQRISEILVRYPETRMVFADYIMKIAMQHELSVPEVVMIMKRVHHMLDVSINETVFAFERRTEEILQETQKELRELSTPIVPIQDGIAILPLIGKFDEERTEHLMNNVVPKVPQFGIHHVIIDFSGIVTIDAEVAANIFNVYNVLELLGINVLITGIRSNLAIRVIDQGINFSAIKTFANVKQAIQSINQHV
jgi:rsbT co-antagonist protein RsbR